LNVEEELKRRNSTQGMPVRPSVQLQVDVSNDSGSMTRHPTPRMGSEANPGGDIEGGEAEDISNHNTHSRHVHRMSSTSPSPSSESPLRRPPYIQPNVVT
jgi:myb proto-oncogene protein